MEFREEHVQHRLYQIAQFNKGIFLKKNKVGINHLNYMQYKENR